jgi:hypothetical protein
MMESVPNGDLELFRMLALLLVMVNVQRSAFTPVCNSEKGRYRTNRDAATSWFPGLLS